MGAHQLGVPQIDPVTPRRGQHALPALVFELPVGCGAGIPLGQHLGQDAVAQAQWRVAEAGQSEAFQQFGEDLRAGHNNLRPPRPNALDHRALGEGHAGQPCGQPAHLARRGNARGQRGKAGAVERQFQSLAGRLAGGFFGWLARQLASFAASARGQRRNRPAQRRGRARGGDDLRDVLRPNFDVGLAQLTGDELPHSRQPLDRRRIHRQELPGQAHSAQRQADGFLDVLALGERNLAASAAQIDQQYPACRSRLGTGHAADQAQVNQPALLEAGDNLHIPAGFGLHPGLKGQRVARIAHGRGGHHADLLHAMQLHRPLKALERLNRSRHRLGRNQSRLEDAGSQPRHLAVFVQRPQLVRHHPGNLQSARVGTNIDGGKGWHDGLGTLRKIKIGSWIKINDRGSRCAARRDEKDKTRLAAHSGFDSHRRCSSRPATARRHRGGNPGRLAAARLLFLI